MFQVLLATLLAYFTVRGAAEAPPGIEVYPVEELNMTAYSGKWFQMYASLLPNITFEHNMYW